MEKKKLKWFAGTKERCFPHHASTTRIKAIISPSPNTCFLASFFFLYSWVGSPARSMGLVPKLLRVVEPWTKRGLFGATGWRVKIVGSARLDLFHVDR